MLQCPVITELTISFRNFIKHMKTDNNILFLELEKQLKVTIEKLEVKEKSSGEKVVSEYIKKYKGALSLLKADTVKPLGKNSLKYLNPLLNNARGYMETSSDYTQSFLEDMNKTDKNNLTIMSLIIR